MISNKSMGNTFQSEFAEILYKNGFWVHIVQQSAIGQPADIICAREGRPYLIDCKNCVHSAFDKNRIEQNQRTAMNLWEECGNGSGWFAVKLVNTIWMCQLWKFEMTDKVKLDEWWFEQNAIRLQQWIAEGA